MNVILIKEQIKKQLAEEQKENIYTNENHRGAIGAFNFVLNLMLSPGEHRYGCMCHLCLPGK